MKKNSNSFLSWDNLDLTGWQDRNNLSLKQAWEVLQARGWLYKRLKNKFPNLNRDSTNSLFWIKYNEIWNSYIKFREKNPSRISRRDYELHVFAWLQII